MYLLIQMGAGPLAASLTVNCFQDTHNTQEKTRERLWKNDSPMRHGLTMRYLIPPTPSLRSGN
ncbi:MAG: hypothetical protein ACTXOO_01805 [Sodalis sp. (in: enterobacteria)]